LHYLLLLLTLSNTYNLTFICWRVKLFIVIILKMFTFNNVILTRIIIRLLLLILMSYLAISDYILRV